MSTKNRGVLAILFAALMWAIEPVMAKLAYRNADFLQTSAVRAIFAGLTALIYVLIKKRSTLKISRKQFSALFYISMLGTLFADLMYYLALTRTPVINAVLIGHMQPIFVVLFGFIFLKEDRLTRFDYKGILMMLCSGLLVTTKTVNNLTSFKLGTTGDLIVLSATIVWATTGIVMRKYIKDMDAGVVTFYRFFFASIVFAVYLLSTSGMFISNIYQILIGIIVGVGTIFYYEGLKRIKAAQVAALELTTPFFAVILGFLILGEIVTTMQIMGICLLFGGIYYLAKKED